MSYLNRFHYYVLLNQCIGPFTKHSFHYHMYLSCFANSSVSIITTVFVYLSELVPPNVAIATNGAQNIGKSYNITCTVNVLDLLIPNTMIQWVKTPPNNTIPSPNTASTTSIHYIEALNTSDAGQYTCIATITIPDIGFTVQGNDSHVIALTSKQIKIFFIQYDGTPFNFI